MAGKCDTVIEIPISEIIPYSNNPRTHGSVEVIKESIKKVGFRGAIWLDKDKVIIAGHGRYLAAKELGIKSLPVIFMDDLSEAETKYLRIKDNRASDQSSWDEEAYLREIEELRASSLDISDLLGAEDFEQIGEELISEVQTINFLVDQEQLALIKEVMSMMDYKKYAETGPNKNGAKLYGVCKEWAQQRR